jgi:Tol biopolymer transport system component/DNA-binding winged helix-turn-helix (wHTH) protein
LEKRLIYQFGGFHLDTLAKLLIRDDQPIHLTRKAAEILCLLAERSPQVVTKDEILASVWPDRVVDDANLAQNIAVIRKALGAQKGEPAWVETFPGRGYRLPGPVTQLVTDHVDHPQTGLHGEKPPARRFIWPAAVLASVAILSLTLFVFRRTGSIEASHHVTPLSRLSGKEMQPALSPDGKSTAFVWQQDENTPSGIWILTDGNSSPRRLTPAGTATWQSPAWSPDGQLIACLRFTATSGDIVILPASGEGSLRVVAPVLATRFGLFHPHLDWSPDGKTLAADDAASLSYPLSIFLVDVESGRKSRLTQPGEMLIGDVNPRFSPDGQTVSFIRMFHRAYQELFSVPVGGGAARQLTSDGRQVSAHGWSMSGAQYYASSRSGEFRIWKIRKGDAPLSISLFAEFPIQFTLARHAPTLAYGVVQNDPNIWRLDLTNPPHWQRLIASSGQDASPQYSPDGHWIAFRTDRTGEEEIWVAAADGSNAVQVTKGVSRPSVPRWAPDSRRLIFNDAISTQLYLAERDGAAWKVHPFGGRGVHPVFSPDGAWIYAAANQAVLRYPTAGGAYTAVVPVRALSLGISPDGDYLYFVREPADTTLSRARVGAGQVERILEGLVPYCTSCWALTRGGIYYLGTGGNAPSQQSVFYLDFSTGVKRLIADYPEPILPIGIGPFSLSPDGKSLLTVRLDPSNSDLLRVDGFR